MITIFEILYYLIKLLEMKDFRNLRVWELSHQITLLIYSITKDFPKSEMYGLTSQLRRAASSIPINIAEGCGRGSNPDFARFLHMSMGSASETEYLLILCKELGFINGEIDTLLLLVQDIKKMLSSLINKTKFEIN